MRHVIEIDYKNGVIKWNGKVWDKMTCEDEERDFWDAVDELVSEIRACEHFEEADAEWSHD